MIEEERRGTAAVAIVAALSLASSAVVLYPGWLSFDSAYQFWQARTGQYSNLSPVVMTALWAVVNRVVVPTPAALLVLHLVAYWVGVALLALALARRPWTRIAFVVGVGFLPPTIVILGHLWTDASLIASMTLAFGLTLDAFRRRGRGLLVVALPVMFYAGAVRHNALLALIPLAGLWAHAWCHASPERRSKPARRRKVAMLALGVVVASFAFGTVLDRALARDRVATWAIGALWDLAAISIDSNTIVIPPFARTEGTDLSTLRSKYSSYVGVPLFDGPGRIRPGLGNETFTPDERMELARAWFAAIVEHPLSYAKHRAAVTRHLFGRYGGPLEGLFFSPMVVRYRDNPPEDAALAPSLRARLVEIVRGTRGSPIFAPALYVSVAFAALGLGWRERRQRQGLAAAALAASGLLLVIPLVVFAPSAELRYCGWLFPSSITAAMAYASARLSAAAGRGQESERRSADNSRETDSTTEPQSPGVG